MDAPKYSHERHTISGPHTHTVKVGDGQFPAWQLPGGDLAIDLRTDRGMRGEPTFNAEQLRTVRVPEVAIEAARTSEPTVGFFILAGQS